MDICADMESDHYGCRVRTTGTDSSTRIWNLSFTVM